MSPLLLGFLSLVILGTSFLSGLFGMAGGLILIGVLIATLPLPTAMMIHGVTQIASNGWRAALWWRHVRWRIALAYAAGGISAFALWSAVLYVPDKALALICLGIAPFLPKLLPRRFTPDPARPSHGIAYGVVCTSLMLLTGAAGPILDGFFLSGGLARRESLATKGACQVFGHGLKLIYFGSMIANPGALEADIVGVALAATLVGTFLAKHLIERMSDGQHRTWSWRIVAGISAYYVAHGCCLLANPVG